MLPKFLLILGKGVCFCCLDTGRSYTYASANNFRSKLLTKSRRSFESSGLRRFYTHTEFMPNSLGIQNVLIYLYITTLEKRFSQTRTRRADGNIASSFSSGKHTDGKACYGICYPGSLQHKN